jgi:Uma2 family endonuclease
MTAILENTGANLEPHRFTVQEYQRIFESGILPTDQRSQLIRGEIYFMSAMGKAHHDALRILGKLLFKAYSDLAEIIQQSPIVVWNDSEPEPDFALIHSDFPGGIPEAKDVLLAIEVSDSTLKFDREKKLPEYARSSISEVWILNLAEAQLEVYREPSGEQFLQLQILKPERIVTALFAPEVTLEWWDALLNPN